MTHEEQIAIDRLRDELHEYHIDVQRLMQRCESCRSNVECVMADLYGLPGNKGRNPGLMGEVADLRRSRRMIVLGLRGAWVLLTAMTGAIAAAVVKAWF